MGSQKGKLIRLVRTVPEFDPKAAWPESDCAGVRRFDICPSVIYDPWYCVACGHPHHGMSRHHRLPVRVAWKIPPGIWREVLKDEQRVVPMCGPCHAFIHGARGKGPCKEAINAEYAKLTWERLTEELAIFDRIAWERTEELIQQSLPRR